MTQAIIFDFGGVLAVPPDLAAWNAHLERVAAELGFEDRHQMWSYFYTGEDWVLAKTGQISDAEFWRRLLAPLGLTTRQEQQAWIERFFGPAGGIHPRMRQLLLRLHAQGRHQLALLSNASDALEETLIHPLNIKHLFDLVVVSASVGLAKPNPAIYRLTLARLGLAPEQTLFIDDQRRNTRAAAKLGIPVLVFPGVEALWAELQARGILSEPEVPA